MTPPTGPQDEPSRDESTMAQPDGDSPHDVPDEEVIEKTLPQSPADSGPGPRNQLS